MSYVVVSSHRGMALDAGRMAVWEFDARRNALTYSPELKRLLGFADEENPSLEEAACCSVEVVKGGPGLRLTGFASTVSTT